MVEPAEWGSAPPVVPRKTCSLEQPLLFLSPWQSCLLSTSCINSLLDANHWHYPVRVQGTLLMGVVELHAALEELPFPPYTGNVVEYNPWLILLKSVNSSDEMCWWNAVS